MSAAPTETMSVLRGSFADDEETPLPWPQSENPIPPTNIRRLALHNSLRQRRHSLTPHEFSFVKSVVETGSDAELLAMEQSLKDEALFFDPKKAVRGASSSSNERIKSFCDVNKTGGSSLRLSLLAKRKACSTQAELWKRASVAVMATNRIRRAVITDSDKNTPNSSSDGYSLPSNSFSKKNMDSSEGSLRRLQQQSIAEDEEWILNSFDDEVDEKRQQPEFESEYSSKFLGEELLEEENHPGKAGSIRKGLTTRRASENLYGGEGFEIGAEELFETYSTPQYDPWDEETDRLGHAYDFHILGTSHYDASAQPHVLSPPLMHALQPSLPLQQRGESFWLKYSMVRDGASITAFLQNLRGSSHTLMAMETVDGEVFGAFTCSPWTVQTSFYGGTDSFLWKMKHSRATVADSVREQAKRETDLEVYHSAMILGGGNPYFQICKHDKIAVGGGTPAAPRQVGTGITLQPNQFGFGIVFEGDYLIEASSAPCVTFNSPSLSSVHPDGSKFELVNLEVWAFTPCITIQDARRMECNRLFLKRNGTCPF